MTATPLSISPNIQPSLNLTIFAVPKPFRGHISQTPIFPTSRICHWTSWLSGLISDEQQKTKFINSHYRYFQLTQPITTPLIKLYFCQADQFSLNLSLQKLVHHSIRIKPKNR